MAYLVTACSYSNTSNSITINLSTRIKSSQGERDSTDNVTVSLIRQGGGYGQGFGVNTPYSHTFSGLSAGTYTLSVSGLGISATYYITLGSGSGSGGGSGGGNTIVVPSAKFATLKWVQQSSYPGDSCYSSSSITNLVGT